MNDFVETIHDSLKYGRNQLTAVYIAALAVLIAISALEGNNADKAAMTNHISASNTYAFFQSKNARLATYEVARDDLFVLLAMNNDISSTARLHIQKKINMYSKRIERYKSEPETGEGKAELIVKARYYEKLRDDALKRDPYFDYSQALLQIAIVLASVSLIYSGGIMIALSLLATAGGLVLLVNGFTLFIEIPLSLPDF